MRNPNGIRTESAWTPNASRAGALHSHIHSHIHSHVGHPCLSSHQGATQPVDKCLLPYGCNGRGCRYCRDFADDDTSPDASGRGMDEPLRGMFGGES